MKTNVFTWKQQAQDFVLRLFVEYDSSNSTPSSDYCTCLHVGTHARLHH